jgi:hypothetical protein
LNFAPGAKVCGNRDRICNAVRSGQQEGLGDRAEARSILKSFGESEVSGRSTPTPFHSLVPDPVDLRCGDAMATLFDATWNFVLPTAAAVDAKQQEAINRLEQAAAKTNIFALPSFELKADIQMAGKADSRHLSVPLERS